MLENIINIFYSNYPLIISFLLFIGYIFSHKVDYLVIIIILILSVLLNHILKEYIFKPLMKKDEFIIIGKGERPNKNIDCSFTTFLDKEIVSTYGMPSGHAQVSILFCILIILIMINSRYSNINIAIVCLITLSTTGLILYNRIDSGCHTYQQVIIGGLIGLVSGVLIFYNLRTIKSSLRKII